MALTMRRLGTWLVVGALVVVGVAAASDAVLNRSEPRSATPRPASDLRETRRDRYARAIAAELEAVGADGVVYVRDDACRLRALHLPALHSVSVPSSPRCRFPASPRLSGRDWRLLRRGVAAALRRHFRSVALAEAVRLSGSRLAAVVAVKTGRGAPENLIVVYERGKVVGKLPWFPSRSARFHVSPRGSFFAVTTSRPDRFFLLDRNARPGALPDVARTWFGRTSLLDARAIAWSPDERWTALAKGESVYLFTTDESAPYLVRLPLGARQLAWRSNAS